VTDDLRDVRAGAWRLYGLSPGGFHATAGAVHLSGVLGIMQGEPAAVDRGGYPNVARRRERDIASLSSLRRHGDRLGAFVIGLAWWVLP
jgi:hypothetical protein